MDYKPETELTKWARSVLSYQGALGASWSVLWFAEGEEIRCAVRMSARGAECLPVSYAEEKANKHDQ